jgi:hypothetical protein
MKYHVYAALIATTNAGPVADEFEKKMPTVAEIEKLEQTVGQWLEDAEKIDNDIEPIYNRYETTVVDSLEYAHNKNMNDLGDAGHKIDYSAKKFARDVA